MKVINNFLPEDTFKKLQDKLTSPFFPWYYNPIVVYKDDPRNHFQCIHFLYNHHSRGRSSFFEIIEPVIDIINPLSLLRVKANLVTRTDKIVEHSFHTDYKDDERITTGILYINSNDGYTKFKIGKTHKSEANKYIEFNSTKFHTGTTCTDEKVRIVVNFNYIKSNTSFPGVEISKNE